jgi:hypothetical protein
VSHFCLIVGSIHLPRSLRCSIQKDLLTARDARPPGVAPGRCDGRQAVFVKGPKERRYHAVFVDQGYCFNAGEWDFQDSPLRGAFARNSVYERVTGWKAFEPTLSRIEQIDPAEIWNVAQEIPPQWYEHDSEALSRLIGSLHQRRSLVRDLITSFRNSTRKPFPNWTEQQSRPAKPKPMPTKEE